MLINTNEYFIRFVKLTATMTQVKAWEIVEEEWETLHKSRKYESFESCKTSFYRWTEKAKGRK